MSVSPVVQLFFAWFLAALLGAAAVHKLRDRVEFLQTLAAYRLLPQFALRQAVYGLAAAELAAAVLLLVPAWRMVGGVAAMALMLVYALAIGINLARGRATIDCGCSATATPINTALVVRNLVLALMAATVIPAATGSTPGGAVLLIVGLSVAAAVLLYLTINQLIANWASHRDLWENHV